MATEPANDGDQLRIAICGRLSIESGAWVLVERDFPARQGRRLWCYLVLERRRLVSRDELAEALWGDETPDGWATTLNAVVSRLRSALRPVSDRTSGLDLHSDSSGLRLELPGDAFIDFERALFGLHIAETALATGDLALSLSESRVALEIAARGFMPGEGLPWVELRRRQLRDTQIHAGECLAEAELRRDQPQLAEREAELLLMVDPLNEHGYRIRMQSAAMLGNRAGVVRAMTQCREMLETVAGTAPSLETERLYRQLVEPSRSSVISDSHQR